MHSFTRERHIRSFEKLNDLFISFSITEKVLFLIMGAVFTLASLSIVHSVSNQFMVEIPRNGGSLTEGVVGTPRFINPLLAVSDIDRDLSMLVYSGLLKATPAGDFIPDLAEKYSVSEDGLTYNFVIRSDARFHDGAPVTAADVEFTIHKTQDSSLKSPRQINWVDVTIEAKSETEISFTLKQPYAPFLANFTLGILPKHVWQNFSSEQLPFSSHNLKPIGSGPYTIEEMQTTDQGIPTSVTLKANSKYTLGEPHISNIIMTFFSSNEALANALHSGTIDSASNMSPETAASLNDSIHLVRAPLTRIFALFFNQNNKEIFAHKEVRKAIDLGINKQALINEALLGYGSVATEVIPPVLVNTSTSLPTYAPTKAEELLTDNDWKKNSNGIFELKTKTGSSSLSFSLATANIPDLINAAHNIEKDLSSLGMNVDVKIFEPNDLNQTVIRPRKYDVLLFGLVTGKNPDLYAFWHSSQRNDPGLNIALYTNAKADKLLEIMRRTLDPTEFESQYEKFAAEVENDVPAVFLWSPDFIYAIPKRLQGLELGQVTYSSDRFLSVQNWYVETDRVWKVFSNN